MTVIPTTESDGRQDAGRLLELGREVKELRDHVAAEGRRAFQDWRPNIHRLSFAASALNFSHYLVLRHRDIRPLQRAPHWVGSKATSLRRWMPSRRRCNG
jgi:hypothetical protein